MCNAVRRSGAQQASVTGEPWDMIRLDGAAEPHLTQRSHDLVHVHVTIVRECLDEVWQRPRHVAEMHFEDLPSTSEIANHLQDALAHARPALRPGPDTKRQPPVRTTTGDLLRTTVTLVMRKQFGNSVHLGHRRIVGMERQLYTRFLCGGKHSPHEVGVVRPDLFSRVFTIE